jgi:hypothetical protein
MSKFDKPAPARVLRLRLAEPLRLKLELLQQMLGTPLNELVNEAVADYVQRRIAEAERDLVRTLGLIKAARWDDPTFKRAIGEFARAEAKHAMNDPMEGTVLHAGKTGSARSLVRGMLMRAKR